MSDFLKTWSAVTPEALKSQTLGLCGHVVAQAGLAGSSRQGWPGIFPSRTLSCSQIDHPAFRCFSFLIYRMGHNNSIYLLELS